MSKQQKKNQLHNALKFAGSGLQMGLTIYLFNMLGKWVDKKYNLEIVETSLTLFAIFGSMYLIIKQVIRVSNTNG